MYSTKRILKGLLFRTAGLWPDKAYLRALYRVTMGRSLDLDNCQTMNEKLQWLKINNRHDDLTTLVDKLKAKDYIASKIGAEYVVPLLKVWEKASDITQEDLDALPDQFVIKTNHSGGNTGVMIVKDKSKVTLEEIRSRMDLSMRQHDIHLHYREWPYKNVERRIFAEAYLGDDLTDYKFYCFNGLADCVLLCTDRQSGHGTKYYFFSKDWKLCRYNKAGAAAPADFTLPQPEGTPRMFELAEQLSKGFPMVRVDFYDIAGRIYFGEMTFYPASGLDPNRLREADLHFGSLIDLSLARNDYK